MATTKIKVNDFIKASKTYVEKSLEKATQNKNAYLSPSEQKKLPKDLRDNLKNYGKAGSSVKTKDFTTAFTSYVAASAKKADANKDGVLSAADAGRLPKDLQDNFKNYVAASRQVWASDGPKDKTSATRIAQHLAAYGTSAVTYSDAFAKGVKAVLADREYGPGNILREMGGPDGAGLSEAKVKAELEKAFKSMTLMPVGQSSESGFDPAATWVFELDSDVGSDHGFWVGVDRQTGDAQVTSFN